MFATQGGMVGSSLRPRRRWWLRILAMVSALALVVAACGNGDNGAANGEGDTGESADAVHGGEVTYALDAETLNFCLPIAQLAISGIMITMAVYDTLVAQSADGEIVPFLAESVEPNEDATVWTITLREGVEFHNGEPLNADAVVMNLDAYRGADPEIGSTLFKTIFNLNPGGLLAVGPPEDLNESGENEGIDTVTAIDDLTVEVTMHEPWASFPSQLYGTGRIGMVAPEQLQAGDDCATTMIGTGPFVQETPGEVRQPRLVRNENYWREDSEGRQLPYLDAITFVGQNIHDQRISGIEGGQFDLTHQSSGEEVASALTLADNNQAFTYVQQPGFREVGYLLMNNGKLPFSNENARKAVLLASDRQLITELRNEGLFTVADGLFDVDVGGHLEPDESGFPDDSDRDAAVQQAREYAEAYEDEEGVPLTFEALTTPDPGNTQTLEIQRENLAEAGIDMSISAPVLQADIIDQAVGGALGTALEDAPEAFQWRNHPGGDCSAQFVWFQSNWPTNFAIIDDPVVDELFKDARQTTDTDERDEYCREVNLHMNENVYNLWTWWVDWTIVTRTNVNGVWGPPLPDGSPPPDNMSGVHRVDGIWLDN